MRVIVKTKETFPEETRKGNIIYKQQAALVQGNGFPLPFLLTVRMGEEYEPGEYELDPNCIRLTRYQSLEIDPYSIRLLPVGKLKAA